MESPISSSVARLTPRNYPSPARSYVLRNDGGRFTDVTREVAPALVNPGGMITDAVWMDFDGDKRLDLVTVGEWMPIQFYKNDGKTLRDATAVNAAATACAAGGTASRPETSTRMDKPDLVAGNLGLNYSYTTSKESPFGIYAADLTGNWTTDVVLTQKINGTEYPIAGLASARPGGSTRLECGFPLMDHSLTRRFRNC